jgi:hypothetical protein
MRPAGFLDATKELLKRARGLGARKQLTQELAYTGPLTARRK